MVNFCSLSGYVKAWQWAVVLWACFFFAEIPGAKANYIWTDNLKASYQNIIELRIEKGRALTLEERRRFPNNRIADLCENYSDFLTMLFTEDVSKYDATLSRMADRLELPEGEDKNSPYYRYYLGEIHLHRAILKLKMGSMTQEISGGLELRKAFTLLAENDRLYPDFVPGRKSYGFLLMVFGLVPSKYSAALSLLGLEGDSHKGLEKMISACSSGDPTAAEAQIFTNLARFYILHNTDAALQSMQALCNKDSDNMLLRFFLSDMLMHDARAEEAFKVLNSRPWSSEYLSVFFISHRYGDIYLYRGDYNEAVRFYSWFLKYYKGKNYIKDTYYKLFLCKLLDGKKAEAHNFFAQIGASGAERTEPDHYAQRVFKDADENLNQLLMRARLMSDGGYYEKASDLMESARPENLPALKDKIEYWYRRARISDKLGKTDEAAGFYRKTIAQSPNEGYYFAPNSALQLAYIYRSRKDTAHAVECLRLALTFKEYPYSNGIESKVKAALHELGQ
ncbi:MAG: tetratricopeptide repeat protein [Bacteroidota bacterium]